ncbi:histone H2B-like [Dendropsophus ebraccatus]|uniref:histone H2B-like n=1 Tax=Dendropsophus ebraccatus TaxID=150705 RepID=UPI0038314B6B
MKPTMKMRSGRRAHPGARIQQKVIEKSKKSYKRHLAKVLGQVQQTTSQQLWALDVLTREGLHGDGFPQVAAEAARLSHYKPRRAIASLEICSALRALYPARATNEDL